jgi:hypothetical protein
MEISMHPINTGTAFVKISYGKLPPIFILLFLFSSMLNNSERAPLLIVHTTLWGRSRDSVISIATAYELNDRGVGVVVLVRSRIFTSLCRPDRFRGPPNFLSNGNRGIFPRGKEAGGRSCPFTSS